MTRADNKRYWAKLVGQANHILSGSSDAEIRVQIFDVLEEFFDLSSCWHDTIDFSVVPNTLDYPISVATGRILRLFQVWDVNGTPQNAVMPHIGIIHFIYPYTNVQPMTADVIKNVTDPLEIHPPHIPDWVLPLHGRVILNGILGYMMLQPGQSYSQPQAAMIHLSKFRDGCAKARTAAMKANTLGAQAWRYPQGFRTFTQKGSITSSNPPGRM